MPYLQNATKPTISKKSGRGLLVPISIWHLPSMHVHQGDSNDDHASPGYKHVNFIRILTASFWLSFKQMLLVRVSRGGFPITFTCPKTRSDAPGFPEVPTNGATPESTCFPQMQWPASDFIEVWGWLCRRFGRVQNDPHLAAFLKASDLDPQVGPSAFTGCAEKVQT